MSLELEGSTNTAEALHGVAECSEAFILDQKELKKSFDKRIMGLTKLVGYAKETEKDQYFLPLMEYYDSLIYINKTQATSPVF